MSAFNVKFIKLSIVQSCTPRNGSREDDKNKFYSTLYASLPYDLIKEKPHRQVQRHLSIS